MIDVSAKLREKPTYENLGKIPYPAEFSETCTEIFNQNSIDQRVKWNPCAEHGYDLSDIPEQFHSVIIKAIDIHNQDTPNKRTCYIHMNQGILAPNETFRISKIHFDAWPETYPVTDYPNNDVFLVSDALPTQFFVHPFENLPQDITSTGSDLNIEIQKILDNEKDEAHMVTPEDYDLVRYDSFTVHRAQIPTAPTQRTFMMVRFF